MSSVLSIFKLVKAPVYSHCFSQDKSLLAITCENTCLVYRLPPANSVTTTTTPQLVATLANHDKTVTAVDISVHGRIVTCSQDRNAYVWEPLSDGSYKPTLVLLRINRAATCVSWAPSGYKFAVGSSARIIAVCYYEQENNWWVSKHIKKPIKSTVQCLAWHSNGVVLAAGATDGYLRLFSGFIKGLDSKEAVANSPWGAKFPFGALVREYYHGAYIEDVQWRSAIEKVAFVSHEGSLNVVDSQDQLQSVNAPDGLPFNSLCWVSDAEILCAGFSCHPVLFAADSSGAWAFARDLDKAGGAAPAPVANEDLDESEDANSGFGISALRKFKQLDLKGKVSTDAQESAHENTITQLKPYVEEQGRVTAVSASGLDGKVVLYRL